MTRSGSEHVLPRWRAVCRYDGTDFHGWQSQRCGNTVQDVVEDALAAVLKSPVRVHGSGRTDSGVHANGQVIHFDAPWSHPPTALQRAVAGQLPPTIQILGLRRAQADFHARFSATGKRYVYRLFLGQAPPMEVRWCWSLNRRELTVEAMREAARALLGKHDFSAFGAGPRSAGDDPVKDLRRLDIRVNGPRLQIITEASGYLYKMVRSLVGSLVEVGCGKLGANDLVAIRNSRRRTHLIATAPARGLCLEKVFFGKSGKK